MSSPEIAALARIRNGDSSAFDVLYTAYVGRIFGFLYRRTLDRAVAEDLTSATFLKAFEKIRSFDPAKGSFAPWLFAIARNVLTDHFRSRKNAAMSVDDLWDLPSDAPLPDEEWNRDDDRRKIRDALNHLDPKQRRIVLLRLWEDLSYKEIAEMLDLTENNCKVIFHRAIAKLKTDMPFALLFLLLFPPRLP